MSTINTLTAPTPSPAITPGTTLPRIALGVVAGLLLLRTVILFLGDAVVIGVARAALIDPAGLAMYADVTIVIADLVSLAVVAMLLRRHRAGWSAVTGPVRLPRDLLVALPVTVVIMVAFVIASYAGNLLVYLGPPPQDTTAFNPPLWLGIWSITVMPITVAVAEELIYRGVALQELRRRLGAVAAVVITSVFFGIQHAALSTESGSAMVARVITTFLAGLVFAVLALRLRRLLPVIIAHWILDVVGLGLPMLMASIQ